MHRLQNLPFLLCISFPKGLKAKLELRKGICFSVQLLHWASKSLLAGWGCRAACHASETTRFCLQKLFHSLFF